MGFQPARISDLTSIISWISSKQACLMWAGPRVRYPLNRYDLYKDIGMSDGNTYILKSENETVAFGQLLHRGDKRGHMARILVAPTYRQRGWGGQLCQELIWTAKQKGYCRVSLNVYRNNIRALDLYKSLGFQINDDNGRGDIIAMLKTID